MRFLLRGGRRGRGDDKTGMTRCRIVVDPPSRNATADGTTRQTSIVIGAKALPASTRPQWALFPSRCRTTSSTTDALCGSFLLDENEGRRDAGGDEHDLAHRV